jgi:hypothetical protein
MQQDTSAMLLAIRNKLNRLSPETATGFTGTKSLMTKLELQVDGASATADVSKGTIDLTDLSNGLEDLNEGLRRLSELAQEEGRNAHSVEAEDIAEDIDVLISSLLRHYKQGHSDDRKRKRSVLQGEDVEAERALKMIKAIVNTNSPVTLNHKGQIEDSI